jgi:hypothetical protein
VAAEAAADEEGEALGCGEREERERKEGRRVEREREKRGTQGWDPLCRGMSHL